MDEMSSIGGRQYKSRRARPCDFCRGRKQACHMEHGPPCRLCQERQRTCTFVQAPGIRKRPVADPARGPMEDGSRNTVSNRIPVHEFNGEQLQPETWLTASELPSPGSQDIELGVPQNDNNVGDDSSMPQGFPNLDSALEALMGRGLSYLDDGIPDPFLSPPQQDAGAFTTPSFARADIPRTDILDHTLTDLGHVRPISRVNELSAASSPVSSRHLERSLDALPDIYYRAIGLTGDLDLYVLNHRQYDENDESSVRYKGLRYRRMSSRGAEASLGTPVSNVSQENSLIPPTVFTLIDNDFATRSEPRLRSQDIERAKEDLRAMISPKLGYRLSLLYAHYVHPNFPILSSRQLPKRPEDVPTMSLPLLAVIAATALPFVTYDDVLSVWLPQCPSESDLFRLAWVLVLGELHTPRLSTIQTCLLMLQRHATNRYVPSTPFRATLMSTAVSLCHCLGLHRDPSQWTSLPRWERGLRKRLWWATWMMEKWITLGESIPSILKDDDFDVEPLSAEDMEDPLSQQLEFELPTSHFPYLVSLTVILSEVIDTFFTVRSAARTSTNLELSLEAAKPIRANLKQWHDALPSDMKRYVSPDLGSGSAQEGARRTSPSSFCRLNAYGSFYLAYLTVQMTLFRALLRPVSMIATLSSKEDSFGDDISNENPLAASNFEHHVDQTNGARAVIKGALAVMKDVVQFAEGLGGSEWDAFWHSCKSLTAQNYTAF